MGELMSPAGAILRRGLDVFVVLQVPLSLACSRAIGIAQPTPTSFILAFCDLKFQSARTDPNP